MTIEKIFTPQDDAFYAVITHAAGPQGALPLTPQMLMESPSGNLFGMTQNAGMGWDANRLTGKEVLIIGTQGAFAPGTDARLRWATTPGTGKSVCRCRRRRRRSRATAGSRLLPSSAIRATGALRARTACSTLYRTATTRRSCFAV